MFKKSKKTEKETPKAVTDAISQMTSPENLDNLEKELKEENGINDSTDEEQPLNAESEPLAHLKKKMEEFSDAFKGSDELTTEEALSKKLNELEKRAEELDEKVAKAEEIVRKRVHSGIVYNHWN